MKQCQVSERSAVFSGNRRHNLRRVEFFCTRAVAGNFRKCWSLVRVPFRASNQSRRPAVCASSLFGPWGSARTLQLATLRCRPEHMTQASDPTEMYFCACGQCSRPNASLERVPFGTGGVELRPPPSEPITYETWNSLRKGFSAELASRH